MPPHCSRWQRVFVSRNGLCSSQNMINLGYPGIRAAFRGNLLLHVNFVLTGDFPALTLLFLPRREAHLAQFIKAETHRHLKSRLVLVLIMV